MIDEENSFKPTERPGPEGTFWVGIAIGCVVVGGFYAVMALLIWMAASKG